jgi:hypothetical protein
MIGGAMTLLTAAVIGLFMFIREVDARNSVQDRINAVQTTEITNVKEFQKKVIQAVDKNTEALNNLRVALEGLKR